jgi:hypothetical protein
MMHSTNQCNIIKPVHISGEQDIVDPVGMNYPKFMGRVGRPSEDLLKSNKLMLCKSSGLRRK